MVFLLYKHLTSAACASVLCISKDTILALGYSYLIASYLQNYQIKNVTRFWKPTIYIHAVEIIRISTFTFGPIYCNCDLEPHSLEL